MTVDERSHALRLRQAGLRVTQPRLLVLRALDTLPPRERDRARQQVVLQRVLEQQRRGLPLSTLYRVLRDLDNAGLLPGQCGSQADVSSSGRAVAADGSNSHDVPDPDHAR